MHDFLIYFLSHRPSKEEWVAFLLVNIVAYSTTPRKEELLAEWDEMGNF